jgi:hypothetical protein
MYVCIGTFIFMSCHIPCSYTRVYVRMHVWIWASASMYIHLNSCRIISDHPWRSVCYFAQSIQIHMHKPTHFQIMILYYGNSPSMMMYIFFNLCEQQIYCLRVWFEAAVQNAFPDSDSDHAMLFVDIQYGANAAVLWTYDAAFSLQCGAGSYSLVGLSSCLPVRSFMEILCVVNFTYTNILWRPQPLLVEQVSLWAYHCWRGLGNWSHWSHISVRILL